MKGLRKAWSVASLALAAIGALVVVLALLSAAGVGNFSLYYGSQPVELLPATGDETRSAPALRTGTIVPPITRARRPASA